MKPFRWCASLAAAAGLAGPLLLGSAASAVAPGGAAATASTHPGTVVAATGQERTEKRNGKAGPGQRPECRGLVPPPYAYAGRSQYFCGDWRLGPTVLPTQGLLGNILSGYHRLGNLTPAQFLTTWWNPTLDSGQGDWNYPPKDGFQLDAQNNPITQLLALQPNTLVDRFGNETGRFLSPAGDKFGKRAIPPSSLNTSDPRYPYDYHLYRVAKPVTVCSGLTAPGFEQTGNGVQYVTSSNYCQGMTFTSVKNLVDNGTLVRLNAHPSPTFPYTSVLAGPTAGENSSVTAGRPAR